MKVHLTEIRPPHLDVDQPLTKAWLMAAVAPEAEADPEGEAASWPQRGEYHLRLTKNEQNVFVKGSLSAEVSLTCARCLGRAGLRVEESFALTLAPRQTDETEPEELELSADDLDFGYFDDDVIDLDALVRERIVLEIPISPLCSENCRGLCPTCGQDLNLSRCGCPPQAPDPRLAKLAGLKVGPS
jgi:uncharacterized protein